MQPVGSGYSMLQLGWPGEALMVEAGKEGENARLVPLKPSVLTVLQERGVE